MATSICYFVLENHPDEEFTFDLCVMDRSRDVEYMRFKMELPINKYYMPMAIGTALMSLYQMEGSHNVKTILVANGEHEFLKAAFGRPETVVVAQGTTVDELKAATASVNFFPHL
jgi:hypothetical protein